MPKNGGLSGWGRRPAFKGLGTHKLGKGLEAPSSKHASPLLSCSSLAAAAHLLKARAACLRRRSSSIEEQATRKRRGPQAAAQGLDAPAKFQPQPNGCGSIGREGKGESDDEAKNHPQIKGNPTDTTHHRAPNPQTAPLWEQAGVAFFKPRTRRSERRGARGGERAPNGEGVLSSRMGRTKGWQSIPTHMANHGWAEI